MQILYESTVPVAINTFITPILRLWLRINRIDGIRKRSGLSEGFSSRNKELFAKRWKPRCKFPALRAFPRTFEAEACEREVDLVLNTATRQPCGTVSLVAIASWCKGELESDAEWASERAFRRLSTRLRRQRGTFNFNEASAGWEGEREKEEVYEGVKAAPRPSRLKKVSPRIAPWNPTGGKFQSRSEYSIRSFARKYVTTVPGARLALAKESE